MGDDGQCRKWSRIAAEEERDSGKRYFEDMSATEQQVLEDYETDKSAKRYKEECIKKLPPFRGKRL